MNVALNHGYPDYVGKRFIWAGIGTGPTSYLAAGDIIAPVRFGNYIDLAFPATTISGAFNLRPVANLAGVRAVWSYIWEFATTGGSVASVAQNVAGSGQTAGTYIVNASGGGGTGAQISVVVATATTLGAITVLNPGKNYTSTPTFTLASGGTPATLTATMSTKGGLVAAGANLSAEQANVGGFGGVY